MGCKSSSAGAEGEEGANPSPNNFTQAQNGEDEDQTVEMEIPSGIFTVTRSGIHASSAMQQQNEAQKDTAAMNHRRDYTGLYDDEEEEPAGTANNGLQRTRSSGGGDGSFARSSSKSGTMMKSSSSAAFGTQSSKGSHASFSMVGSSSMNNTNTNNTNHHNGVEAWQGQQQQQVRMRVKIQRSRVLGKGGYGVVYAGYNEDTREPLAVKEVVFSEDKKSMLKALQQEFKTLNRLDHDAIVRVYNFTIDDVGKTARVFMEMMPGGSLRSWVRRKYPAIPAPPNTTTSSASSSPPSPVKIYPVPEVVAKKIMYQALEGLAFLHSQGIIHRDFKPDNVLVASSSLNQDTGYDQPEIKLSDFGTSRETLHMVSGTETQVVGTVCYMAPEGCHGSYSRGTDVWAWAATFLELVKGSLPWSELGIKQSHSLLFHIGTTKAIPKIPNPTTSNPAANRNNNKRGKADSLPLISQNLVYLLTACFANDPKDRPSPEDLLEDPYFAEESREWSLAHQPQPESSATTRTSNAGGSTATTSESDEDEEAEEEFEDVSGSSGQVSPAARGDQHRSGGAQLKKAVPLPSTRPPARGQGGRVVAPPQNTQSMASTWRQQQHSGHDRHYGYDEEEADEVDSEDGFDSVDED